MMREAHSFSARGPCAQTGYEVDALCVFYDTKRGVSALAFFDELDLSLRQVETLPDCVVVIADAGHIGELQGHWESESGPKRTFENRGTHNDVQYVKCICFAGWAPGAEPSIVSTLPTGTSNIKFDLPVGSFIRQGVGALVSANPVVQVAPAGHVFKHLSKTVNKLFIQARELATSEAELGFVGRCISTVLPVLAEETLSIVYIDTMGIYALVREALTFARSKASVHSFHSYAEVSELSPPSEPYALVISASTSGGMARQLYEEQQFEESRMLTLIDTTRENRRGGVMISLQDVDKALGKNLADGTETQIELFGEHFASKSKPPRAVTLGQSHIPKRLLEFLRQFGVDGLLGINRQATGSTTSRLICFDGAKAGGSEDLKGWLKQEIDWRVSIGINHIVHAGDAGSQALAEAAADKLHKAKGCAARPGVSSYVGLTTQDLAAASGVLVVQAIVGDGGLLREISRDLRELLAPGVPRHFVVGVGLPQSEETWLRLQQFLAKNGSSREYDFSAWLVLPIGADGTANAWQALATLAPRAQVQIPGDLGIPSTVVSESMDRAAKLIQESFTGFLPTSEGNPLGLSEGFLFFGDAFKTKRLEDVPPSTTYVTVAAAMQAARENSVPANQLKPNAYESVVLAPENFLRFNDNLLQACILRAAHPSELDYSSSPDLSRLMKEFLLKVFTRHAHPYGAASLEFAAALACGRVKLIASDRDELQKKTIQLLGAAPSALLGLVCFTA